MLADYNISFMHIKGKHNILADAISKLKMLNIYEEPLENPKVQIVSNSQSVVMEICATSMHTVDTNMLCNEQKWDKTFKKLASQVRHSNKNSFKPVTLSANGISQKHQYVHSLQHDVTIVPCSLVPDNLHEFHGSKGHQGTIHTFKVIRRCYWWPKLQQDIVKYIGTFSVCTKHLPYMVRYPQQHLEVSKIPMAVLAMDTIGHLSITSEGKRWALTAICFHMSYMFAVPMKETSAENVVQAYLSGILACYCYNIFLISNGTDLHFSLCLDGIW